MGMERVPAITSRPEREILWRIYVCGVANLLCYLQSWQLLWLRAPCVMSPERGPGWSGAHTWARCRRIISLPCSEWITGHCNMLWKGRSMACNVITCRVRRRLCVTRGPTSIHHQVACWRCVGLAGEDACGKSARMLLPQRLCQWQFLTLFCMRAAAPKITDRLVVCALVCILGCTTWPVLNDCKRTRGVLQRARKNWVCMPRPLRMRPLSITVPV